MKNNNKSEKEKRLFRRIDLTGAKALRTKNVYIDYLGGGGALESVPGYRKICSMGQAIHNCFSVKCYNGDEFLYIHCGEELYRFHISDPDKAEIMQPIFQVANQKSYFLNRSGVTFFTDGVLLLGFDPAGNPRILSRDAQITGCRAMEIVDGRLFLGGNPDFPGHIFCSSPLSNGDPSFFEAIRLSKSAFSIKEMLAVGNKLWVFRSLGDDGQILRISKDENSPCYIEEQILSGIPTDAVMTHLDRLVFLSRGSLYSMENLVAELPKIKKITEIPINVMPFSLQSHARLGFWMGYISVMTRGKILLIDTRANSPTIYPIEDIGEYKNDRRVYRYSSEKIQGYKSHPNTDHIAKGDIFSLVDISGRAIHYEASTEGLYLVYPTDERCGGELIPASLYLCNGEQMWFATESGEIFLFNTPGSVALTDLYDEENNSENSLLYHRLYSFADHRPQYLIEIPTEDGERPDLRKRTLPGGLSIEGKNLPKTAAKIRIICDHKPTCESIVRWGQTSFSNLDFSNMISPGSEKFDASLPHGGPPWYKMQIIIEGCDFATPIAISAVNHSLALCEKH